MKVLIVEDRPELVKLFVRQIEPIACEVIVAMNRETASDIIRATAPLDLITVDLGLPDSPAHETIEWLRDIRAVRPNAVVVVISGVVSREEEKRVLEAGADGFIHKTEIDDLTLLQRLAQILRSIITPPRRFQRNVAVAEALAERFTQYIAHTAPRHG